MTLSPRLVLVSTLLMSTALAGTAAAQPGQPPPPPPGYGGGGGGYYAPLPPSTVRRGLAIGFGLGLGNMEADSGPIACAGCDFSPIAGGADFHIGAMLAPNLAVLFEIQGTGQQLDAQGATTLQQIMLLGAVQYWLSPMLWLKGGLGSSHLAIAYDDGYEAASDELDSGIGVLGAIGYEVLHSPRFAIDVQLRLSSGSYDGLDDELHSGILGVGFNWY